MFNARRNRSRSKSTTPKSVRPDFRARFETLEGRRLLTADVWTGAGTDSLFSNAANWSSGVPTTGQDITFPSGVTNKTVTVDSNVIVGNVEFDDAYTLSSANGQSDSITLSGGLTATNAGTVINNPIVLTQPLTTTLVYETAALTLNGAISDGGNALGLSIQGNGPLTLAGDGDTYTGTTEVQGGVLDLNTDLTSVVDVYPTSSFNGSGSVTTLEGNNGYFAASNEGAVPGTVNISNSMSLDTDSNNTVSVMLDGNQSSQFVVNGGTISLGDAALTGTAYNGYVPASGTVITIIKNNTGSPVVGTFDNLAQGATVDIGGEEYTISYTGGSGNDVTLTAAEATSSITLTSSHVPVYQGHTVTLTATVAGAGQTPTGTVTFFNNGTAIGSPVAITNGVATINDTTLPVGTNLITASYSGDSTYAGSTTGSALTANVRANSTATTPTITSATSTASTHGFTIGATVVGADTSTAGAAGLIYTWTAIHLPSGAKNPTFSANGTNAASSIIARFSKDGGYILQCKVSNAAGNYVTTDVYVTVSQKATSLKIEPHQAQITKDGFEQYAGTVLDQFGHAMRTAQTLAWAVTAGPGSIDASTGLFAATATTGVVTIELEADDLTATVGAKVV
jgi:autotransporter-associated beta strand protein